MLMVQEAFQDKAEYQYHGLPEIATPMRRECDAVQMAKDMEESGEIVRKVNSSRRWSLGCEE